jgi:ankyrin repeat protein
MKHLLITTIAAVLLVGCGPSTPDISIHDASMFGKTEAVKQHIAAGTDVNAKDEFSGTPLVYAGRKAIIELLIASGADVNTKDRQGHTPLDTTEIVDDKAARKEIADPLRKYGGKTGEELKAEAAK